MTIKVYGMSTYNAQRVTLALLEFGIEDFELIKVDFKIREHLSPEFMAMNPFHQIPVFESGDFRLYESRAIVHYIAEKYKDQGPNILGTTLEEKALVNQWVDSEAHRFNDFAFAPWSMEFYLSYMLKRPLDESLVAPLYEKLKFFFWMWLRNNWPRPSI
jgi:glutathione S-transferase